MAVWNVVPKRSLWSGIDLAAEHYHPDKISMLELLGQGGGKTISTIARPVKEIVKAPPTGVAVFDTNAASSHILTEESAQQEERISAKKIGRSGDILISRLRSYLKQVAWIPEAINSAYLTTEFIVLRSREDNKSIAYLLPFLLSKPVQTILHWSQDGSEHPRFKEGVLLSLNIPKTVLHQANRLNAFIRDAAYALERSLNFYSQAQSLLLSELGLDKIDLSPSLFYEARYSETVKARRMDAEYFQPKYARLLGLIEETGQSMRLGDYLQQPPRRGIQPEYSEEGDIIVINSQHVGKNGVILDGNRKTDRSFLEEKGRKGQVKQYDVLLNSTGYITIGRAQTLLDNVQAIVDSHITILRAKPPLDPVYLGVFLNAPVGFLQTERNWTGSSGQIELRKEAIADFRIWLAPERVQRQIREYVEKAHAARQESKRLIDKAVRLVEEAILGKGQ